MTWHSLLCVGAILLGPGLHGSTRTVVGWGNGFSFATNVPADFTNIVAIAAGDYNVALRENGTLTLWGLHAGWWTNVSAWLTNVVAIANGIEPTLDGVYCYTLALRSDGTVAAWGINLSGGTNVPAEVTNVVSIAAGVGHCLALRSNGTVVAWGYNSLGQATVPSGLTNVIAITAGPYSSMALTRDGEMVAWGYLRCAIDPSVRFSNVVSIAAGPYGERLILLANGMVITNCPGLVASLPSGLTNVVGLSSADYHDLALRSDGTVIGWGYNCCGQVTAPSNLSNVIAISASEELSLALIAESPVILRQPQGQTVGWNGFVNLSVSAVGTPPITYQWRFNGMNVSGETNNALRLENVRCSQAALYSVIVSNASGTVTSSLAEVNVALPLADLMISTQTNPAGIVLAWPAVAGYYVEATTNLSQPLWATNFGFMLQESTPAGKRMLINPSENRTYFRLRCD